MGPRAGLDGCGKSRPNRNSIPGPSAPERVTKPTELSRPSKNCAGRTKFGFVRVEFLVFILKKRTVSSKSACGELRQFAPLCLTLRHFAPLCLNLHLPAGASGWVLVASCCVRGNEPL